MKKSMLLIVVFGFSSIIYSQALIPFPKSYNSWGYCNVNKEIVILPMFEEANPFINNRAIVNYYGDYVIIDNNGIILTQNKYNEIYPFSEGIAAVLSKGNKVGFIDSNGNEIIPCKYDYNELDKYRFSEGRAFVRSGDSYGYIDITGKTVIDFQYSKAFHFQDGFALVRDKNKAYCLIEPDGKVIVTLVGCTDYHDSSEGLIGLKIEGKWGFLDKTGNEVIPFIYDYAGQFSEGLVSVVKGKKEMFIDKSGTIVLEPKGVIVSGGFHDGMAKVEKKEKVGFINREGEIVIPCIYSIAYDFKDGYAVVQESGWNGKEYHTVSGLIDKTGAPITAFENGLVDPETRHSDGLFKAYNKEFIYSYVSITGEDYSDTYAKSLLPKPEPVVYKPLFTANPYDGHNYWQFHTVEEIKEFLTGYGFNINSTYEFIPVEQQYIIITTDAITDDGNTRYYPPSKTVEITESAFVFSENLKKLTAEKVIYVFKADYFTGPCTLYLGNRGWIYIISEKTTISSSMLSVFGTSMLNKTFELFFSFNITSIESSQNTPNKY
ncbi:MAG TPA: WG repeat-containing protein [Bacteroidales bacterium]